MLVKVHELKLIFSSPNGPVFLIFCRKEVQSVALLTSMRLIKWDIF